MQFVCVFMLSNVCLCEVYTLCSVCVVCVCVCVCVCERERERKRQRQRERETERERDTETEREKTERQREREDRGKDILNNIFPNCGSFQFFSIFLVLYFLQ